MKETGKIKHENGYRTGRRILSLFLVFLLLIGTIPSTAFGMDIYGEGASQTGQPGAESAENVVTSPNVMPQQEPVAGEAAINYYVPQPAEIPQQPDEVPQQPAETPQPAGNPPAEEAAPVTAPAENTLPEGNTPPQEASPEAQADAIPEEILLEAEAPAEAGGPVVAVVATAAGNQEYSNFSDAWNAAASAGAATVTLMSDWMSDGSGAFGSGPAFSAEGSIIVDGANITINGGGHAIRRAGGSIAGGCVIGIFGGSLAINNAVITGGSSTTDGGGILSLGGALSLTGVTITGNSAAAGGGLCVTGGSVSVTGSIITGNAASNEGGGIYVDTGRGSLALAGSVQVQGNASSGAGDLFISGNNGVSMAGLGAGSAVSVGAIPAEGDRLLGTAGEGAKSVLMSAVPGYTLRFEGGNVYLSSAAQAVTAENEAANEEEPADEAAAVEETAEEAADETAAVEETAEEAADETAAVEETEEEAAAEEAAASEETAEEAAAYGAVNAEETAEEYAAEETGSVEQAAEEEEDSSEEITEEEIAGAEEEISEETAEEVLEIEDADEFALEEMSSEEADESEMLSEEEDQEYVIFQEAEAPVVESGAEDAAAAVSIDGTEDHPEDEIIEDAAIGEDPAVGIMFFPVPCEVVRISAEHLVEGMPLSSVFTDEMTARTYEETDGPDVFDLTSKISWYPNDEVARRGVVYRADLELDSQKNDMYYASFNPDVRVELTCHDSSLGNTTEEHFVCNDDMQTFPRLKLSLWFPTEESLKVQNIPEFYLGFRNGTSFGEIVSNLQSPILVYYEDLSHFPSDYHYRSSNEYVLWDRSVPAEGTYDPSNPERQEFLMKGYIQDDDVYPSKILHNIKLNTEPLKDSTGRIPVYTRVTVEAAGTLVKPVADPAPGTYNSTTKVALNAEDGDATIYYTTDGSDPREPGTSRKIYGGPITLPLEIGEKNEYQINAYCVKEGMKDSSVASFQYTIDGTLVAKAPYPSEDSPSPAHIRGRRR